MIKRIRIALAALAIAFALAFSAGPFDGFFGGFAGNTVVAVQGGGFELPTVSVGDSSPGRRRI